MSRVVVFGGSGYVGAHVVEAAAVTGLDITSITRNEAPTQIAGAKYRIGSITDPEHRAWAVGHGDVIVVAISPRGDMFDRLRPAIADLALEAGNGDVRLGVIGGAGSLLTAEQGPRLVDSPTFSEEHRAEALVMADVLDDLRSSPDTLDWFYVSPPAEFGPWVPGEFIGEYRIGGDVLLKDENGRSTISGADFGVAVLDEIEDLRHHRARFTVAY